MLTRNAPHRPALPAGTLLLALLAGSVALVLAVLALTPQTPAPSEVAPTAARAVMNVAPGIEAPDITLEKAPRGLTDYIRDDER